MLKKITILLSCMLSLYYYFCHWTLPSSATISIPAPEYQSSSLLIPLDSRPVCTKLPQRLANLAGTNLILPPKELLDNYHTPAKKEKVYEWLHASLKAHDSAIISTDMLLSGGLLQARKNIQTPTEKAQLISKINKLALEQTSMQIFQVIPRLLVSDELIPNRWYKYRLLRYSQLQDMVTIFGDLQTTKILLEEKEKIPQEILEHYLSLFKEQDQLNLNLLKLANPKLTVTIGQDDGAPLGLPHLSAQLVDNFIQKQNIPSTEAALSYGADEIASVLVAQNYLQKRKAHPKIFIQYADKSIPNLIMPYLPITTAGVLQEKIKLLGCQEVQHKDTADLVLYVNCGHDNYLPRKLQAEELSQLLKGPLPVALIDLTANFEEKELLLPQALKYKIPLNRLVAYAGWNTFSNSAGTALAQGAIIVERLKELSSEQQRLELLAANLRFNLERFLDDFIYQKKLHANLKRELLLRGIDPTELNAKNKNYAQSLAQFFLKNQAMLLLHENLGQTPFYENNEGAYYLKDITLQVELPWNRIFEIALEVDLTYGKK